MKVILELHLVATDRREGETEREFKKRYRETLNKFVRQAVASDARIRFGKAPKVQGEKR